MCVVVVEKLLSLRERGYEVWWKSFPSNGGFGSYLNFISNTFSCWTVVSFNATLEIRLVATGLRSKEQEVLVVIDSGGLGCWRCFSGELLEIHTSHWPCPDLQALLLLSCSVSSWSFFPDEKSRVNALLQFNPKFVHAQSLQYAFYSPEKDSPLPAFRVIVEFSLPMCFWVIAVKHSRVGG